MKSLTDIFQGFDKCTKAILQNNYFWGTPCDDCCCLETWSRYYYHIKRRKFKTILIWRSSRKMNRNKNLLILNYFWKKLSKFSNVKNKVSHTFPFQPCSTVNFYFFFMFHFVKLIALKVRIIWGIEVPEM